MNTSDLYLYSNANIHILHGSREPITITMLDSKRLPESRPLSTAKLVVTDDDNTPTEISTTVSGTGNNVYAFTQTFSTGWTKGKNYSMEFWLYPQGATDPLKRFKATLYLD